MKSAIREHTAIMGSLGTQKSICRANPAQIQDNVFEMFEMHGKVTIITGGSGGIGNEVGRAGRSKLRHSALVSYIAQYLKTGCKYRERLWRQLQGVPMCCGECR